MGNVGAHERSCSLAALFAATNQIRRKAGLVRKWTSVGAVKVAV